MPNFPRLRLALTSFCLGMIVLHVILFWVVRRQIVAGSSDFRIFYAAGLMLRRGENRALYNQELQAGTEREFALAGVQRGGTLPYNHPPFEAILYVPLTYLRYFPAYCLWFVINILLLAGSIYRARSYLPTLLADFRPILILAPLAFFPIAYALLQGQDSIILMALYFLAYCALREGKDVRAGVFLGLGLFKFHLVLPFAFVLLLRRRWRTLAGMTAVALAEMLVSWAMVGGSQLIYYPRFAWQVNRQQAPGVIVPQNMANLRGLFLGWNAMNPPSGWVEIALVLASVGLIVWASRQWKPTAVQDPGSWNFGFSLCVVASYMAGYHGYNQDMSLLLLPVLLALDWILAHWTAVGVGFKVVLGVLLLSPLYLLLTLKMSQQNLFSIVLLCFAGYLAAYAATTERPAWANRSTGPPGVPPQ